MGTSYIVKYAFYVRIFGAVSKGKARILLPGSWPRAYLSRGALGKGFVETFHFTVSKTMEVDIVSIPTYLVRAPIRWRAPCRGNRISAKAGAASCCWYRSLPQKNRRTKQKKKNVRQFRGGKTG
eukprot:scaffold2109_cov188-Amphora_coffeaeformis.AAC.8